jgi:hypothetical protein
MAKPNSTGFRKVTIGFHEQDTPLEKYEDMAFNQGMRADYMNKRTPEGVDGSTAADKEYNDSIKMLVQTEPHGHILLQQGSVRAHPNTSGENSPNGDVVFVGFSEGFHEIPLLILLIGVDVPGGERVFSTIGCATSNGPICMFTYFDLDQSGFFLNGREASDELFNYPLDASGRAIIYWTAVGV